MQILITGRHIEITEDLQKRLESRIEAIFADTTLKVSSVRVVLDLEKSRCRADLVAYVKHCDPFAATSQGYDVIKVIDDVTNKLQAQISKYIDRVQEHRGPSLHDLEEKEAVESI